MPACLTPMVTRNKYTNKSQLHPCGKCPNCLKKRVSEWSFRLMQEDKISSSSYFITLTYDTKYVPISRNGFLELRKKHLQDWFKRLRYYHKEYAGIRYYACGEYGGKTRRPHYHIIMFNAKLELIIGEKYAKAVKDGLIPLDGVKQFNCESWPHGHVTVGSVGGASVGYTLKYINKPWKPMHRNDDRQPVFALMSKRLGENYLTPKNIAWHKKDLFNRMYLNLEGGKKCSMPRYYKEKIYGVKYEDDFGNIRVDNSVRKAIGIAARAKKQKPELKDAVIAGYEVKVHIYEDPKKSRARGEAVVAGFARHKFNQTKTKGSL